MPKEVEVVGKIEQAQAAIDAAGPGLRWFVLEDLKQTLRALGAELVVAGSGNASDDS